MGNPDQTEKLLLDFNDEFADVFSAFVFKDKLKLDPDRLQEAATEYHHLENGKPKELRRDVVKLYDGLSLGILVLGFENQSDIDPLMPIRMMGYNWTRYRYQASIAAKAPPTIPLSPIFSHVINFSYTHQWTWPLSLKDIVSVPPALEEFFQDYKITVTNVAWLSQEDRAMLSGDFRILADTLCAIRETGKIPAETRIIRHVDELLATLAAVTHRNYCIDINTDHDEGEKQMTMNDVLTKWEQALRAEGFEQGEKAGFEQGEKAGFVSGKNRSAVQTCQDLGKSEDDTIFYLMQKFSMTREEAQYTTLKYWQN